MTDNVRGPARAEFTRAEMIEGLRDDVAVQVADAETLLAMKVFAAQKRGRRELEDLEVLIPAVGLSTVDEVEALYASFYPGDDLTDRTATIIQAVLDQHGVQPPVPPRPALE